jgi:hypothetical protein
MFKDVQMIFFLNLDDFLPWFTRIFMKDVLFTGYISLMEHDFR